MMPQGHTNAGGGGGSEGSDKPLLHFLYKVLGKRSVQKPFL